MSSGAAVFIGIVAFSVPLAFSTSASADPGDPTTTTVATTVPSTSTTAPGSTWSTSSTMTTTTQPPTSITASPPVNGEGVVILGANGETILAELAVAPPATGQVLAQTGGSSTPLWLAGVASLGSGALALTFKRRRHLNLYTLRSSKRP